MFRLSNRLLQRTASCGKLMFGAKEDPSCISYSVIRRLMLATLIVLASPGADTANVDHHLTRNFVADAVEVASPSVVTIDKKGSGFIISKDGFVATNAHVVAGSKDSLTVTLWDGSEYRGVVHSIDNDSDLALVKIENALPEKLPVSILGKSGDLRAGEFVLALGCPLLLQRTVTFGIVSKPARSGNEFLKTSNIKNKAQEYYIQTDASMHPGNSGGPLVNIDGHVIGINSMSVLARSGIALAIPIDYAKYIFGQLMKQRNVDRWYFGMNLTEVAAASLPSEYSAEKGSLPSTVVMVGSIIAGSPAANAFLSPGDLLIEIDDKPVKDVREVLDAIGYDINRTYSVRVLGRRHGHYYTTSITSISRNVQPVHFWRMM